MFNSRLEMVVKCVVTLRHHVIDVKIALYLFALLLSSPNKCRKGRITKRDKQPVDLRRQLAVSEAGATPDFL